MTFLLICAVAALAIALLADRILVGELEAYRLELARSRWDLAQAHADTERWRAIATDLQPTDGAK